MPIQLADLQSVACPTTAVCFAVGGLTGTANDAVVLRSVDRGQSWYEVLISRRLQALSSISCPTVRECVAVGSRIGGTGHAIARTSDGGLRWQVSRAPNGMSTLSKVSCPGTAFCVAIGQTRGGSGHSWFLRSTDGGKRWTAQHTPKAVAYLQGLSCASPTTCTAVGDSLTDGPAIIERSTDGGLRWKAQRAPHGATILDSVTCPDTQTCYAFSLASSDTIDATHDGGRIWFGQKLPEPAAAGAIPMGALGCMTSRACAVAAASPPNQGFVFDTANGGSAWRNATLPLGVEWLLGIGCSSSACVAVGVDGQILLSPTSP
jgi:photosystem II stability/assembly factor-like uncharacterized protein